jgi:hypothetical protein
MNKILALLVLMLAIKSGAQIQFLDTTTQFTNVYSTHGKITAGTVFTNTPYSTSDYTNVVTGEIGASAGAKLNSDLAYLTNYLTILLQLPSQIGSNLTVQITGTSNLLTLTISNQAAISNSLVTTMATVASFPGSQIQSGTVETNKLTASAMTWFNSLQEVQPDSGGHGGTTLKLNASDTGAAWWIHVDSSGAITATSSP